MQETSIFVVKCLILSSLCQFGFISIESKSPETAVLLLKSPEEDVIVKACEAIFTFAEKGELSAS